MLKLYRKYLKKNIHLVILGPCFKIIEAIFELLVPFVIKNMIDNGVNNSLLSYTEKKEYIINQGIILFLFAAIGLSSTLVCQFIASRVSQTFGTDLRNDLYRHINTLSFKELDQISASSLINRETNDIYNLEKSVAILIRLVIRSPLIIIGSIVMSFVININAGILFVISAILISLIFYLVTKFSYPNNQKVQKQVDEVTSIAKDNLIGARQVRSFRKEEYEKNKFKDKNNELTKFQLILGHINSYLNPMTFVVVNIAIVILIYLGGFKIGNDTLSQGDIQALINYQTQIFVAIVAITGLVQTFTKAASSASRVNELFSLKSSLITGNEKNGLDEENIICFNNVSFSYSKDAANALNNLNFTIKKGETVGIIGGTGAGKTTLAHLIAHFYDPTQGNISYKGRNIQVYDKNFYNDEVAYVFQHASLFRGTIKSNLLWGNKNATEEEINHALNVSQADFAKKNLDGIVLQKGQNLSGGQRQRLGIARALLKNSEILILDDSSSALDYKTDYNLRMALKKEKYTTIIISQRAASISYADKILVLDNGNLVGLGKHNDLLQNCDVYQEICQSQAKEE